MICRKGDNMKILKKTGQVEKKTGSPGKPEKPDDGRFNFGATI